MRRVAGQGKILAALFPAGASMKGAAGEELSIYSAGTAAWFDQDISMGGRILVDYGSPTRILHVNNLGTTTVTNDQTGAELQDELFYPWGQDWTRAGQPYVMHFAGMAFESPDQLYLTDFRKYNSALGRWMTPDPLGMAAADPSNPQSWNRYAYVTNNPTTMTDPLGLFEDQPNQNHCKTEFVGAGPGEGVWKRVCDENDSVTVNGNASGGPTPSPSPNPGLQNGGNGQETGGAGGSGFTLGVRARGQSYKHCLASTSSTYSIAGLFDIQSQAGKFALGNDVSSILFGDSSEGSAGLLLWEGGSRSFKYGVGTAMTAGRRTASIFDLNLLGKTGPAPRILAKTGAEEYAAWLSGAAELKLFADFGLAGAQAIGCLIHQ